MLVAALFLGAATLFAQLTPYEYAKRWYVSLQGGMVYFNGDWTYVFREYPGEWLTPAMPAFGASVGYGIANGHELRLTASYGKKKASCISYDYKLYPYSFHSVSLVADYVLAFMALEENYVPFSPKMYVGPGVAYTFGFTDPHHPKRTVSGPNWVGCAHFGAIFEYNFPFGLGLFTDVGLMFLGDPYDGQGWYNFRLDMEVGLQMGVVYHFK